MDLLSRRADRLIESDPDNPVVQFSYAMALAYSE